MDIELIAIVLGIILVSMTLHEVMHGFAAYWLGDDTAKHQGRLTLNPLVHIDPIMTILLPVLLAISGGPIFGGAKPVPFNPSRLKCDEWGVALVAAAGPFTNLVIAFLSFGIAVLIDGGELTRIFVLSAQVNLGFFAFNMLPIPPLDGSRLLYVIAPDFVRRGMEQIERYGIMLVFLLIIVANPLLVTYMTGAAGFFFDLFSGLFGVR